MAGSLERWKAAARSQTRVPDTHVIAATTNVLQALGFVFAKEAWGSRPLSLSPASSTAQGPRGQTWP